MVRGSSLNLSSKPEYSAERSWSTVPFCTSILTSLRLFSLLLSFGLDSRGFSSVGDLILAGLGTSVPKDSTASVFQSMILKPSDYPSHPSNFIFNSSLKDRQERQVEKLKAWRSIMIFP